MQQKASWGKRTAPDQEWRPVAQNVSAAVFLNKSALAACTGSAAAWSAHAGFDSALEAPKPLSAYCRTTASSSLSALLLPPHLPTFSLEGMVVGTEGPTCVPKWKSHLRFSKTPKYFHRRGNPLNASSTQYAPDLVTPSVRLVILPWLKHSYNNNHIINISKSTLRFFPKAFLSPASITKVTLLTLKTVKVTYSSSNSYSEKALNSLSQLTATYRPGKEEICSLLFLFSSSSLLLWHF